MAEITDVERALLDAIKDAIASNGVTIADGVRAAHSSRVSAIYQSRHRSLSRLTLRARWSRAIERLKRLGIIEYREPFLWIREGGP